MYPSNKDAWKGLIYTLLYPALLGSMLYDIFSPAAGFSWNYVTQMILVCIYLVDYLYLYNDWMGQGYPGRWQEIFCDAVIAVLYRLTFGFVGTGHPTRASLCLIVLYSLYLSYEIARNAVTRRFISLTIAILLINLPVWFLTDDLKVKTIVFAITAVTTLLLLSFYVFYYSPKYVVGDNAEPPSLSP